MNPLRDEFLSEEDLDLKNMTEAEVDAWWTAWLEMAQVTNEADCHAYSHGVFEHEPPWPPVRLVSSGRPDAISL